MKHLLLQERPGAMLLITVLIVGSVALTIALSTALKGIGELDMALSEHQSFEVLAVADACGHEALLRLTTDASYTGGSLNVGDGMCTITVTPTGSLREISITATIARWERRLYIRATVTGARVQLNEWTQI